MQFDTTNMSSFIQEFVHETKTGTLHVRMKNGGVYTYSNFSRQKFYRLRVAVRNGESVGSYYNRLIKSNSRHPRVMTFGVERDTPIIGRIRAA